MAINIGALFPSKTTPGDADYLYGSARNVTTPGDGTGTPWDAAILNDVLGFQQSLLSAAGVVPSGNPDKIGASQYLEAMQKISAKNLPTLAAAITDKTLLAAAGQYVYLTEHTAGKGGGGPWVTALLSAVTPNEIDAVTCTGVPTLALLKVAGPVLSLDTLGAFGEGADDSDRIQAAIDLTQVAGGWVVGDASKTYLTTKQITVKHGVKVDFNNASVAFVQGTTNNDSPFQMGNNTVLKNITKGTYNSTSASAFSTLGWVKVGEFYTTSGENSFDNTYWLPDNVEIENVHSEMSEQLTEDSRGYTATVSTFGAINKRYNNISCDGLCADGNPSKTTRATVRSESGIDINAGQQGYNWDIFNIIGRNLRAQSENAVVYINGDANTHVRNVYGDSCGAILGVRPNRLFATQDPSMRGRSGLNVLAENIIGVNCRKEAADTSTHLLSALYLRSNEGDDLSNNKSAFIVRNVALFSTEVLADKLSLGVQMGDTVPLPSETNVGTRRVVVSGFEVVGFTDGFNEEVGCIQNVIENGFIRNCDKNGANFNGERSTYKNIKTWENNQGEQPDANNGHGVRIGCKKGRLIDCSYGNPALGAGNETQKSSVFIVSDDTTARLESCHFDNYKTGENMLGQNAVTGANVYVDQYCDSQGVTASKTVDYHLSPDVVKCAAVFNTAGATQFQLNCTVAKGATGKYDVTFDKPMANTDYRVVATSNFQYSLVRTTTKTVNGFQIASRDDAGADVDTGVDFVVYGDYDTTE